jgi:hypothetical protein
MTFATRPVSRNVSAQVCGEIGVKQKQYSRPTTKSGASIPESTQKLKAHDSRVELLKSIQIVAIECRFEDSISFHPVRLLDEFGPPNALELTGAASASAREND